MNAMREGLQNAYQYSKTVNGPLAQAMDLFASSAQVVRNQLGAALGGTIVAILPLIQTLANAIARAAEYVTMFFAALNGQSTYKKAINNTVEWGKAAAGAGKAAKEWKNQLMGFDEINRLEAPEEPSGGGGGGGSANFGDMFKQAPVADWMERFGERVKELLPILKVIGVIIGGLSLAKLLGQVAGLGDGFKGIMTKLIGLAVALAGFIVLWDGFKDAINNGVDWGNLTEMLIGTTVLVTGLGVAFGATGAAVGLLIGMFMLAVAGLMDIIRTGEASKPALTALAIGIAGIGIAISILTGSWIPLLIGAAVGLVIAIVGYWDEIKGVLSEAWDHVVGWVNSFLEWIQPVIDAIHAVWDFLIGGAAAAAQTNAYGVDNKFPAYASGGFPEDGLFMANHGELVGQFSNGQTAVANNAEIVAGIERGVYNAMSAVMANQNNDNRDVHVYLDGRQISNAVTRNQRNADRAMGAVYG